MLWHVRMGELFLDTGTIPTVDSFSHTFRGQPIPPHSFLVEIVMAIVHRWAGWAGITVCTALAKTLLFELLWRSVCRLNGNVKPFIWIGVGLFWVAAPQLYPPQLYSFVLFALLLTLAPPTGRVTSKGAVGLGFLACLLWPLFHPSFFLGTALLLLYALVERPRRFHWASAALTSVTLIAWIFPTSFSDVLKHVRSDVLKGAVGQWKPLFSVVRPDIETVWILCNVAVLAFLLGWTARKRGREFWLNFHLYAIAVFSFGLAMTSVRFLPLFVIGATPIVLAFVGRLPRWLPMVYAVVSTSIYITSPETRFGLSLRTEELPVQCVDALERKHFEGEMFNSYNFGSYLIYRLKGEPGVFIDPRATQLYSDEFLSRFLKSYEDPTVFEQMVAEYNVGYTVLANNSPRTKKLIDYLDNNPVWKREHLDPLCMIHHRTNRPVKH